MTVPPSYQERELLIKVIEMRVRRAEEDPLFSGNKGKERRRVMPSDGRTVRGREGEQVSQEGPDTGEKRRMLPTPPRAEDFYRQETDSRN